ncbi:xanthine dehydrogenase family protein molybdopterin-binding subunit [Chloroflexota bacterium]
MTELSIVGKSVVRTDAREKVMGRAGYFTDVSLPGMLHMLVLRSPYSHARISNINTAEADTLPGVKYVVTNQDAPQVRWGNGMVKDQTVLAKDVVRYVGEPVAAVAAETVEAAEAALDLIRVEYEMLPAVFDPEEAISPAPPAIIHPDFSEYSKVVSGARLDPERPNVFTRMRIRKGDVEDGFQEADLILENRFSTPSIQHCTLEPHGVVVCPESNSGLTFRAGRQGLWSLANTVSEIYGLEASQIRVVQQYSGGGFGAKIKIIETIPALLALKTGRPVKWVFTREEEFIDGGHRPAVILYLKDGVKKDGTLVAREMRVILGGGAYENITGIMTRNSSFGAVATYRVPNLKWDSYGVYTNEPPVIAFRGFGVTETVWAIESHMDMLAEKLGISPLEIRQRNILEEGEMNSLGEISHSIGLEECLGKANAFIKPGAKPEARGEWRQGKGIAIGSKYSTGMTFCQARIKVSQDGSIVLYHGADEIGQGCNTVMAQIVAEEFGVSMDDVRLVFSDTAVTPVAAGGSTSSRVTFQLGNAVRAACRDAKRNLFERASGRLGVSPDELETRGKEIFLKRNQDKKLRIDSLFTTFAGVPDGVYGVTDGGEIIGTATRVQESSAEDLGTGQIEPALGAQGKVVNSFYAHVAKAVEVAVNTETGQVKVLRCCAATDLGKMINPMTCEQQSEGGIAMGIGDALYEEMIMDRGTVVNPGFTDYKIPSVAEIPFIENIKSVFVESTPHKDGPFGAKGFGEAAMIAMEPAIANAIHDAVGIRIKDLPISREKVLKALSEKKPATSGE